MAVQPEQAGETQVVGGSEGMETAGAALGMPVAIDSPPLAGSSAPPLPVTTSPVTMAPGEVLPAGGVLYKVNSSRASFGELRRDTRGIGVPVAWITKLLQVRMPGSVNDPNVESLRPFEVGPASFPKNVAEKMAPMLADLAAAGFGPRGLCHTVVDLFNNSRLYIATLPRKDGRAVARVVMRTEGSSVPPKTHLYCDILNELQDGRFLWTTGARATLDAPAGVEVRREAGAAPARLWTIHQQRLDCLPSSGALRRAAKAAEVREMLERHHVLLRDHHLKRKLFVAMSSFETEATAAINMAYVEGSAGGFEYPEILAEMERLQNKRTSWVGGIVVLAISLLLFVGAESGGQGGVMDRNASREMLLILVGVLFFHELGHWAAMKLFRYRNVRMFFIPFFGAAVSGTNYSAPGWKKVVVSLMGPVPGIFLGGALGIAGMVMHHELLVKIAMMSVILNGSNLIPVLPLDGGRVMQALLFSRHYAADVIFRALAAGALLLIAVLTGSKWFIALGVAMGLAVPLAWRLGRVAAELKREGLRPPPPDTQKIPPEMAQAIINRLKSTSIKGIKPNNKTLAQNALTVYESICARPPGWLATIGFGALHAGSVVVALVLGLVLLFARGGTFAEFARAAAQQPQHRISPQEIVATTAPQDGASGQTSPGGHKTLIADFTSAEDASSAFADFRPRLDPGQKLTRFGQTLLVSFPAEDDGARKKWLEIVAPRTKEFCVDGGTPFGGGRFRLMCVAHDGASAQEIEEELEEYFSAPSTFHLVPPWSAGAAPSAGQWEQYRLARKTYRRLVSAGEGSRQDPAIADLNKRVSEAFRQGDSSEARKIEAERGKMYARRRDEELGRLAALNDGSVDAEVVKEYIELQKKPVKDEENVDEDEPGVSLNDPGYQRMAARMGQIELSDGKPVNGSDRYNAKFGSVHRTSLLINIPFLNFEDAGEGAPAVVRWLDSRGCKGVKYEFEVGGRGPAF